MKRVRWSAGVGVVLLGGLGGLAGCMAEVADADPDADPQTLEIPPKEAAKGPGAAVAETFPPLDAVSSYLDGFHFYSGELDAQVEAHHYVTALDEGLMQAIIFDGNGPDAKLIGIEYILSEDRFAELPAAEKLLWHSHGYEVKSGLLIAPELDPDAEHALMGRLVHTYGKTWHTWHGSQDSEIPLGIPALMMGFTADGQIHAGLVADRDQRFGVDTERVEARREDIPTPEIDPLADAWEQGDVIVLEPVNLGEPGEPADEDGP